MQNIWKITQSLALTAICMCLFSGVILAQAETDTTEEANTEVSLELRYVEVNNKSKILEAIVKSKPDGTWRGAENIPVKFYRDAEDPANLLGEAKTNKKGLAGLILDEKQAINGPSYTFVAVTEATDQMDPASEEVSVLESSLGMELTEADSVREVHLTLSGFNDKGEEVPAAEVEIRLYVKRLFGLLPISDDPETTDENGEVTAEFPAGFPGDSIGNLVIVAKVEDHESFGNLEFQRKLNWGTPVMVNSTNLQRELWSSRANAPIYLIVIVNLMLFGIWGIILYIAYQTYKIKTIATSATAKANK